METIKKILELEKINYTKIQKSDSGFTNFAYFIDNKYVVKVIANQAKREKLQKEIEFYKNTTLQYIPKYISSGCINDIDYLIIEKLEGCSLFEIWHTLDNNQRSDIVIQIAQILKDFHKQNSNCLDKKYITLDWVEKWNNSFLLNIDILKQKGYDTTLFEDFRIKMLPKIFEQQKPSLVYNDAHFDNFLYHNGQVKLIDFDRILYCSMDYELLIIKQMLDNPIKFASEKDEPNVDIKDYQNIYSILKTNYPELFDFEYLEQRVFVYQFIYNIGQSFEYHDTPRLEMELNKFLNYFYKK